MGFHDPLAGSASGDPHGSRSGVRRGGGQAAAPQPSANGWRMNSWLSDQEVHPLVQLGPVGRVLGGYRPIVHRRGRFRLPPARYSVSAWAISAEMGSPRLTRSCPHPRRQAAWQLKRQHARLFGHDAPRPPQRVRCILCEPTRGTLAGMFDTL
jgi:hypothetical protein